VSDSLHVRVVLTDTSILINFLQGEISDPAELARLRKALLEYCRQDTLGLVRLLEKMRSMDG
jgi:hypothetical protein